jgi:hypothetical protein
VSAYYSLLDGEDHEWSASLDVSLDDAWRRTGPGLMLRGGVVRFENEQLAVLDVDRYLGGLTLTRLNVGSRAGRMAVTVLGGRDEATDADSPYGNDRLGARLSGGWLLAPQSSFYAEAAYLEARYDEEPGFFGLERDDEEWSVLLATEHRDWPGKGWIVTPRLRYIDHVSSVSLYEYDRWEASVLARRDFR